MQKSTKSSGYGEILKKPCLPLDSWGDEEETLSVMKTWDTVQSDEAEGREPVDHYRQEE